MIKGIDMKINLNNGQHYVYSPGSVVEGSLEVSVDKPKDYDEIIVELWGGASVCLTVTSGFGNTRSVNTYNYYERNFSPQSKEWRNETAYGKLPIGVHTFPFSFHFPQDIPSSFHTVTGQIKYEIRASICQNKLVNSNMESIRPWTHEIKALLNFENRTPKTDILRPYSEPITASRTKQLKFLFLERGSITATMNLPRTGFSPGEVIPITVDVCNESSRQIRIAFVLKRKDLFTVYPGTSIEHSKIVSNVIVRTLSSPIMPGAMITLADNNVIIPIDATTIQDCSCICAQYTLKVIIKIPWSINKIVRIPLTIAYGAPVTEPRSFGLEPQHPAGDYVAPQPPHNPVAALTTTAPPS